MNNITFAQRITHFFRKCQPFKVYVKVDHYLDSTYDPEGIPSTTAIWKCAICNNMGRSDLYGWGYIELDELNNPVILAQEQSKKPAVVLAFSQNRKPD